MSQLTRIVFVKSNTRTVVGTNRVAGFLDRSNLSADEVDTIVAGSDEAVTLIQQARTSGAFKNGKVGTKANNAKRKSKGDAFVLLRKQDGTIVWACANPTIKQLHRMMDLLEDLEASDVAPAPAVQEKTPVVDAAAKDGEALDATTNTGATNTDVMEAAPLEDTNTELPDANPNVRWVALLGNPETSAATRLLLDFVGVTPNSGLEVFELGSPEALHFEPIFCAFLGRAEGRRPLLGMVVDNEATCVEIEPNLDAMEEGRLLFQRAKLGVPKDLEDRLPAASGGESLQTATEAPSKPNVRLVVLLGDRDSQATLRAVEFYCDHATVKAELMEFGTKEAADVLPMLLANLGRDELRRPMVATLVDNEAVRVDVEPDDDVMQEGLEFFMLTALNLHGDVEEVLQPPPSVNRDASQQSAAAS